MFDAKDDRFKPGTKSKPVSVVDECAPNLGKACSVGQASPVKEMPVPSDFLSSSVPASKVSVAFVAQRGEIQAKKGASITTGVGSIPADPLWLKLEIEEKKVEHFIRHIYQLEKKLVESEAENNALIKVIAKLRNELDGRKT